MIRMKKILVKISKLILVVSVVILTFYIGFNAYNKYYSIQNPQVISPVSNQESNVVECSENKSLREAKLCTYLIGDTQKHGTGFLIDKNGYIVTNFHVINHSTDGYVNVWYNKTFNESRIVGYSEQNDIAVIKIEPSQNVCSWYPSANLELAETVYAVGWPGNPYGESTITKGIFSRYTEENTLPLIQTDTPINSGNSGGPLINKCGVVGINNSKQTWISDNNPSEGIGYAIQSEHSQSIVEKIIANDTGEPIIPITGIDQINENESLNTNDIPNDYFDLRALLTYDYSQVIFWEQRRIQDEITYNSWRKARDSEFINQNKLNLFLDLIERSIEIAKELWDGYTNSKLTYTQMIELKEEYLRISQETSILSKELNYEGNITAYSECIQAWERLEEEYDESFDEQKEECEKFIKPTE